MTLCRLPLMAAVLFAIGCGMPVGGSVELTLYAAASLEDALSEIGGAYETATPGVQLAIATDSSATLRTQIEQGAPADVFLSADTKHPQGLVDKGLADGMAVPFIGNRLTIIVPSSNPAGIRSPADLAGVGVRIVAAGDEVPISAYANEVVTNLAGLAGYPTDFADAYARNVVSREDDVRVVVAKIQLGEGDAAIVYATDPRSAANVKTIEIPAEANVTATYAGVVVKASDHRSEAKALLDWVAGPAGSAIFERFGFVPLG